ncbi:AAA family ATPase [Nocardioides insulae]|uniref:AAA family ATPase n=1 Tax=Nocardioides insulae TaxID=394734 RepID=UPI00048E2773|nr:AAA family ATPase [Nocardioides insulae]
MSEQTRPTVHLVIGPAGSGKSRVSRELARRSRAAYLDKDTIAGEFTERLLAAAGHDPHDRDNNAYYRDQVLPLEYAALLRAVGDNLRVGTSVVVDAPFGRFLDDPEYLREAAQRWAWPPARRVVVQVATDGETVRRRVAERGYGRDTWKLAHWEEFWRGAGAPTCAWTGAERIVVDNNEDDPDLSALAEWIS